ncbi:MAG: hypothetical protein V4560_09520 [Bacteroidota bacterium]
MKIFIAYAAFTFLFIINVNAQKLPGKQKQSLRAPSDIKIDGLATEWSDKFQAYNNAVDVFYTISNDDTNLYLTVKAKYRNIVDKILRGGITFIVNSEVNKKDKNNVSITYPVLEGTDMFVVANKFSSKSNEYEKTKNGTIKVDDLNELFQTKEKLIAVTGVETIIDPSISIYNSDGIKTAALFDNKMSYTYELALPIVYLKLPNNGKDAFSYRIKINEVPIHRPLVITSSTPPPPPPVTISTLATTDFWGEYTLAKK